MAFLKKTKKLHGTAVREQRRPNRLGDLHEARAAVGGVAPQPSLLLAQHRGDPSAATSGGAEAGMAVVAARQCRQLGHR